MPPLPRGLWFPDQGCSLPQHLREFRHLEWRAEKAPAALCRKVAVAALTGEKTIQIWGEGKQTRSFTYIDMLEEIAGVRIERGYELDAPQGVRGRSSDNTEIMRRFGWAPANSARQGLERTYAWSTRRSNSS